VGCRALSPSYECGSTGLFAGCPALRGLYGARRSSSGDPVAMVVAQGPRRVLGERVAVALAVGGTHEGRHDLQVPVRDVCRLAPEIGEAKVDIELEQIDARRRVGHRPRLGEASDGPWPWPFVANAAIRQKIARA